MRLSAALLAIACIAAAAVAAAEATGVAQQATAAHPTRPSFPLGYVPYRVAQQQAKLQPISAQPTQHIGQQATAHQPTVTPQAQPLGVGANQQRASPIDILQQPTAQVDTTLGQPIAQQRPIVAQQQQQQGAVPLSSSVIAQQPVAITEPVVIIPVHKAQISQQQPIVQQQPIKLGTGAQTTTPHTQPIVQQPPVMHKPLVQQQPIIQQESTVQQQQQPHLQWSGVQKQTDQSSSSSLLNEPIKLKGAGQQQQQQVAEPLSNQLKKGIMRAHKVRRTHSGSEHSRGRRPAEQSCIHRCPFRSLWPPLCCLWRCVCRRC